MNLNQTYFHGTLLVDALKIERVGFNLGRARGRGAFLGPGVYVSAKRDWAMGYVKDVRDWDEKDAALLHLRLRPDNPLDADPNNWPESFKAAYEKDTGKPAANAKADRLFRETGLLARRLKYDAIIYDKGTSIVFDPKKIQVIKVEPFPVTKTAYSYDKRQAAKLSENLLTALEVFRAWTDGETRQFSLNALEYRLRARVVNGLINRGLITSGTKLRPKDEKRGKGGVAVNLITPAGRAALSAKR